MLTDPTSTLGFAFGEKLTSAAMTTIATQQPRAWDIVQGGTYTATGNSTVNPTSTEEWTINVPTTYDNLTVFGGDLNLTSAAGTMTSATLTLDSNSSISYASPRTIVARSNTPGTLVCRMTDEASGSGGSVDFAYGGIDAGSGLVSSAAVQQVWVDGTNATFAVIDFDLTPILRNGTIEGCQVSIDPAGAIGDPESMPQLSLWRRDALGAEAQIGATVTDSSGTYRTQHFLTLDVSTAVSGDAYEYAPSSVGHTLFLRFRGENGNNSTPGLLIQSIAIEQQIARIDHF